ncbi:MAG: hypothetical protein ACI9Y1_000086 [Lentisphaeria bacterium]|jgi:hypothetical protein
MKLPLVGFLVVVGLRLSVVCTLALLSACTLTQTKQDPAAASSLSLLQEQQSALGDHAVRLEALAQSQEHLKRQLGGVQNDFSQLNALLKTSLLSPSALGFNQSQVASATADASARVAGRKAGVRANEDQQGKAILGRVEYIWLEGSQQYLKARIDTGARSSSIHAKEIQPFERDGERWVRFSIISDSKDDVTLEAPLLRYVRIRQASVDDLKRRPVVELKIQLGKISEESEFSLSNRSEMLYPVLLGRSFLKDIAVVDVAKKFTRRRDAKLVSGVAKQ